MIDFRPALLACALSATTLGAAVAEKPAAPAPSGDYVPDSGQAGKDVVWVPTQQTLVDNMLAMAKITKDDYVVDLGSGDGRTVITAARQGVRAHGVEFNGDLVAHSRRAAKAAGVGDLATFEEADIFATDFSKATVVTLFLLTDLNIRLRPTLLDMKPGTRIVSNSFGMGDWEPDDRVQAAGGCYSFCNAMKWVIPAKAAGQWRLGDRRLELEQKYQMLTGTLTSEDGQAEPIEEAKMNGHEITFMVGGKRYAGRVDGATMSGVAGGEAWSATRVQS